MCFYFFFSLEDQFQEDVESLSGISLGRVDCVHYYSGVDKRTVTSTLLGQTLALHVQTSCRYWVYTLKNV